MKSGLCFGLLGALLYATAFLGIDSVIWPMIYHFRHRPIQVPELVEFSAHNVIIPFLASGLIFLLARVELKRNYWPIIVAPFILLFLEDVAADSFFHILGDSVINLLVGMIQALGIWVAWWVSGRFHERWLAAPK